MKKLFITLSIILGFVSCTNVPEDAVDTLNELGLNVEVESITDCMSEQLAVLYEGLEDESSYNALKEIITNKNIKTLVLANNTLPNVTCDYAIIDANKPINEMTCDPSTQTGELVSLPHTNTNLNEDVLTLTTCSQDINMTLILFEVKNLDDEEMEALISQLTVTKEEKEYISFQKIDSLSINFDIFRDKQSYVDKSYCGEILSFDALLNQLGTEANE